MVFDLENPLVLNSEEGEEEEYEEDEDDNNRALFLAESDQMPLKIFLESSRTNGFLVSFRQKALSVTSQAYFSGNLNRSVLYLAINYMDRFIIIRQDLQQSKQWMQRLIVIACVSLASKMKNLKFSAAEFQGEDGLVFDARTIERMESVVLDALNWRMRSITPFSFIRFFISRLEIKDLSSLQILKERITDIIFKSQKEVKLIEFRPSVVAAAAVLVASNRLFKLLFPTFQCSILSCKFVNNDNLLICLNIIEEIIKIEEYDEVSIGFETSTKCSETPWLTPLDWPQKGSEIWNVLPENRRIKRRRITDQPTEEYRR